MRLLAAALGFVQWLHVTAAMLLFGSEAFVAALVPASLAEVLGTAQHRRRAVATIILVVTVLVWLPLQTGRLAGEAAAMIDPGTLRTVLSDTTLGRLWLADIGLLVLLAVSAALQSRPTALAFLAGCQLALTGLVGHATIQEGWLGAAHHANHTLHLLSAGAWLGALVPLLATMRQMDVLEQRAEASLALRRFSSAGHGVVTLVLVTGILNTILVTGTLLPDTGAPYGRILLGKLALVAAMVWLAVCNRYVLVPSLTKAPDAARDLRRLTAINTGFGIIVILVSVALGLTDPAPR